MDRHGFLAREYVGDYTELQEAPMSIVKGPLIGLMLIASSSHFRKPATIIEPGGSKSLSPHLDVYG